MISKNEDQSLSIERRLVDIYSGEVNLWINKNFREIKAGNKFRMFDPVTKEPIKNSLGETEFVADTDAYLAPHKELKKTVYHVQIKGNNE